MLKLAAISFAVGNVENLKYRWKYKSLVYCRDIYSIRKARLNVSSELRPFVSEKHQKGFPYIGNTSTFYVRLTNKFATQAGDKSDG